jgi:CheY-like chemotaxis protein
MTINSTLKDLNKVILIADDDDELKENLITLFKRIAPLSTCVSTSDGQGALEAIKKRKFDLLILDLLMPKMDGKGLVESLVNIEQAHRPSFLLVISGTIQGGLRRIGKTTFLPKPFSSDDIQNYLLSTFQVSPNTVETERKSNPELYCFSLGVATALETLCSTHSTKTLHVEKSASLPVTPTDGAADITIESAICYSDSQIVLNIRMEKKTFLRIIARMLGEPHIEIKPELHTAAAEFNAQVIELVKTGKSKTFQNPLSVVHTVIVGDRHTTSVFGKTIGFGETLETDVGAVSLSIYEADLT